MQSFHWKNLLTRSIDLLQKDGASGLVKGIYRFFVYRALDLKTGLQNQKIILLEGKEVVRDINGSEMILDMTQPGLEPELARNGIREQKSTERFLKVLREIQENHTPIHVFDIGANIGYYVLPEARILGDEADIYAIEPEPRNVAQLKRNVERNGYDDVTVSKCGISDSNTTTPLDVSDQSNLHQVSTTSTSRAGNSIDIETRTLDSIVDEYGIPPTEPILVRMDIEGHEQEAINGMSNLLSSDQPMYLFMEVHNFEGAESQQRIFDTIEDAGFELDGVNYEKGDADRWVESFDEVDTSVDDHMHLMARRL